MSDVVGIQLLEGGKVQYFLAAGQDLKIDTWCVVETEHGPGVGRVVKSRVTEPDAKGGESLRRVVRHATPKDMEQIRQNERLERDAYRLCRKLVLDKNLSMKLVDVTYTLDGRKAIFYFTSENRVDFRELVKELAHSLKVKIEMRQIGVRDEARRLGGVGCCGQSLCCCTFLKDFVSVSIRMAKDQNVSLNPTKVSGICGRLMCCLSYEYDGPKAKQRKSGPDAKGGEQEETHACAEHTCTGCAKGHADAEPATDKDAPKETPKESLRAPHTPGGRPDRGDKTYHSPNHSFSRRNEQGARSGHDRGERKPMGGTEHTAGTTATPETTPASGAPSNAPGGGQPRRWFKSRQEKKNNAANPHHSPHGPNRGGGGGQGQGKGPNPHGHSRGPSSDKR